jgi:hypothetical protein
MPFIPDEDSPSVKFSTHVWRDDDDDDGIANSYTSEAEAKQAFDKLEVGGQFQFGGIYRWVNATQEWACIDAWPETFDGGE